MCDVSANNRGDALCRPPVVLISLVFVCVGDFTCVAFYLNNIIGRHCRSRASQPSVVLAFPGALPGTQLAKFAKGNSFLRVNAWERIWPGQKHARVT
jgi:hypothetical protein